MQGKKRQRFITLSHQLYQLLIAPVAEFIPAEAPLMICAENNLHFVPIEVLISEGADRPYAKLPFLLKTNPVNYHYSATTYVNSRMKVPAQNGIVTFAQVFDDGARPTLAPNVYRSLGEKELTGIDADGSISPLPATRAEVTGIATAYPGQSVKSLLGRTANKEALRTALSGDNTVIHIATHGFINEDNHDLSALACYNEENNGADLLYANDIRNEKVKADLVVLSSCESGLGRKVRGKGPIALNRAFHLRRRAQRHLQPLEN